MITVLNVPTQPPATIGDLIKYDGFACIYIGMGQALAYVPDANATPKIIAVGTATRLPTGSVMTIRQA